MAGLDPNDREPIDRKTSRSICDAVGERLQKDLRPDLMGPAPELDRLMDELRRRETESGTSTPGPSRGGFRFLF